MSGIIQVAGIRDKDEADMLIAEGVHQLGFPLCLDVHREDANAEEVAEIIRTVNSRAKAVLITYLKDAEGIVNLCQKIGVGMVQIHGEMTETDLRRLKKLAPHIEVIKSLIVKDNNFEELVELVHSFTSFVDGFITDSYDPVLGASGATGKVHDWNVSQKLVRISSKPVMLAGGLRGDNVREAILTVRPSGVDVHTGVEGSDGRKDRQLVHAFVREAISAFKEVLV